MTSEQTFLSALVATPDDELTWLALADWLEEGGQTDRAEMVRTWQRLRGMKWRARGRAAVEARLCELLAGGARPIVPEMENSVGMRFVLVPPGRFWMGSPKGEAERYADERLHEVEMARPFWLGVFPVTQAQYRTVAGNNPSDFGSSGGMRDLTEHLDRGTLPVESVSWRDAEKLCAALGELRGEVRAGRKYRLPSEAEWEYACRGAGAHRTPFHFGPALSSHQANFNGAKPYGSAAGGPELGRPTPVGTYRPNVLGLYDMHGNIWEYCASLYYPTEDENEMVEGQPRVLRGGAWASGSIGCRAAHRGMVGEDEADTDTGFRVVLEW